ncbi:MAG: hypothetical protein M3Q80_01700 [bacterium]|nr:hypothetical protein [bacterium]
MKKYLSLLLLPLVLVIIFAVTQDGKIVPNVEAQTAKNVTGWLWASNIGWISLGGASHQVTIDSSGNFAGFGWSPHIGWINFAPSVSTCPSTPLSACVRANVNLNTGAVVGWIQAEQLRNSSANANGWIELSGTNHTSPNGSGVKFNTTSKNFSGYAWSPSNSNTSIGLGWVSFDAASCPACAATVVVVVPKTLNATFTASTNSVTISTPATPVTLTARRTPLTSNTTGPITFTFTCYPNATPTVITRTTPIDDESASVSCTYSTPNSYTASVVVTQDSISTTKTATITATDPQVPTPSISLYVGPNIDSAQFGTATSRSIIAGDPFGLKWNITGGINCRASVPTQPTGQNITFTNFNANTSLSNTGFAAVPNSDSRLMARGDFKFRIDCKDKYAEVNVNVFSSQVTPN